MTCSVHPRLLTIDEACSLIGTTAIALVDAIGDRPERLPQLLSGPGSVRGLAVPAANAARAYRVALRHVHSIGLGWVVADQVDGALSYAGLDSEVVAYIAA
jgi:hypothetical protein